MSIQIQGLGLKYGSRAVLHGISLTATAGRVLGIVGPNGSGKSTLVKAVAGLLTGEGTILFNGSATRPRHMAYMPQDLQPPLAMTVLEVVLLGRLGQLRLKVSAQDLDAVQGVLRAVAGDALDAAVVAADGEGHAQDVADVLEYVEVSGGNAGLGRGLVEKDLHHVEELGLSILAAGAEAAGKGAASGSADSGQHWQF